MNNMESVIVAKSDQMNSDDLIGGSITITVKNVKINESGEQRVSIGYEGDGDKPWKPCKSMCRVIVANWGADTKIYYGRKLTLYRDAAVKWAGMEVGGIRISHMSHIPKEITMALTATRGNKKPFTVKPIAATEKAEKVSALPDSVLEKILVNGETAASKGVAAYSDWLKPLSAEVKEAIKHKHAEWSAIAKQADRNKEEDIPS